jgi:hypothetical protein
MWICLQYRTGLPVPCGSVENGARPVRKTACITETNGMHFVLFGIRNTTVGPYLAAIHRTLIPSSAEPGAPPASCAIGQLVPIWQPYIGPSFPAVQSLGLRLPRA